MATSDASALMLHVGRGKEVRGELAHQSVLRRVAGSLGPEGPADDHRLVVAALAREPDNPVDPGAVCVLLDGEAVGYIPSERAPDYHPFLAWARAEGYEHVLTRAHLVGGYELDGGGRASLGIYLDHSSPPAKQYDGNPPTLTHSEAGGWGDWGDVNVTGEEGHQDFLAQHRFRRIVAELQPDDRVVHVAIDGRRIGRLTTKMSLRYRPGIVSQAAAEATPVTVFANVISGPNKLEVAVRLPIGESLAGWSGRRRY